MKKTRYLVIYYLFLIMYLEIWHNHFIYQNVFSIWLLYTTIFSFFLSLILTFLSSLGNPKKNKIVIVIITFLLTLAFAGNYLYYSLFSTPFTIHVTSLAGQAFDFIEILFKIIFQNLIALIILFIPLFYILLNIKKMNFSKIYFFEKRNLLVCIALTYIISLLILIPGKDQDKSAFRLYWKENDLIYSIKTIGFITAERLDIQRAILGFKEDLTFIPNINSEENKNIAYNKMNIDFETLVANEKDSSIKSIYNYFNNEIPTKQNEYTGIYKGKNLIFILAESFNTIAISKELTPTLYRLTNSGFHFNNFYSPTFLSTTGGEFQAMTSLIPSAETLNEWYKGKAYLPFALGNVFKNQDYNRNAYHNYEATFYNREQTMNNLGFPNYLACLNGLEKEMICEWKNENQPNDLDLINVTFPKYGNQTPFLTYYITMSGHFPYRLSKEKRNYDMVKDLPYSDTVKSYLASQIDLDKALESLIKQLEKEGILDDTVICLVGDHYPYSLTLDEVNEISDYERDDVIEVNHSDLIIWNNDTKIINIDKVGSQIDILPTILNLFGIEYDSRLLIGNDLLSDTEGLAIFSDMSWISDSGTYLSKTNTFTPKKEVDNDYVSNKNKWVNNTVKLSKMIITEDIYGKIFKGDE